MKKRITTENIYIYIYIKREILKKRFKGGGRGEIGVNVVAVVCDGSSSAVRALSEKRAILDEREPIIVNVIAFLWKDRDRYAVMTHTSWVKGVGRPFEKNWAIKNICNFLNVVSIPNT
jgi:hypothetical protein